MAEERRVTVSPFIDGLRGARYYILRPMIISEFCTGESEYLHCDGTWHKSTYSSDGISNGYYDTKNKAIDTAIQYGYQPE